MCTPVTSALMGDTAKLSSAMFQLPQGIWQTRSKPSYGTWGQKGCWWPYMCTAGPKTMRCQAQKRPVQRT